MWFGGFQFQISIWGVGYSSCDGIGLPFFHRSSADVVNIYMTYRDKFMYQ